MRAAVEETEVEVVGSFNGYTMYLVSPQRIQAIEIAIVACAFAVAVVVLSRKGRI